jgi:hypothetical protein
MKILITSLYCNITLYASKHTNQPKNIFKANGQSPGLPVRIDCRPERQKLGDRLRRYGVIQNFQHDPSRGEVNGPSDYGGRQQHNQQQLDENVIEIPSFELLQGVIVVVKRLESFAKGVERVLAGRAFQFDPGPLDETFQTENVTASGPRFLDVRAEANGALAVVVIESS